MGGMWRVEKDERVEEEMEGKERGAYRTREEKGRRGHVDKPGTTPLDTPHHGIIILGARILYLDGRGRTLWRI